jgi:hypothetical protein
MSVLSSSQLQLLLEDKQKKLKQGMKMNSKKENKNIETVLIFSCDICW